MEHMGTCEEAGCIYKGSTGIFIKDFGFTDEILDIITPKDNPKKAIRNLEKIANKFYNSANDQQPEPYMIIIYAGPEKVDRLTIADLTYDKIIPHEMIIQDGVFYPKNPPCKDANPVSEEKQIANDQRKELVIQVVMRMKDAPAFNGRLGGPEHIFHVSRGLYVLTDHHGCCDFTYNYKTDAEELLKFMK